MKKIEMIAKWRVLAMLNYINNHINDTSHDDMLKIIGNCIQFINDITDVSVVECKAEEFPKEWSSLYDDGKIPLEITL